MPRIPRQYLIKDALSYHVFNRGNAKLDVFHDSQDYEYFLHLIKNYKLKYNFQIYHWILMPNHFHLSIVIQPAEKLSKCIWGIQQSYAQYHHKKWNSAGALWQGRFKSQPVQKENYLYECGRYIERNPVKAGLVKYPWDYQWSSCGVYIGNKPDEITILDPVYESLGASQEERISAYKDWLMKGEDDKFDKMDTPVGDKDFAHKIVLKRGRSRIDARGRPKIILL